MRTCRSCSTSACIGFPPAIEAAAYFVCSEALANIAKHARATRITLRAQERGGWLLVTVSDDGVGGADPAGSGLAGLADRVEALGGSLRVTSPGGTAVAAEFPLGEA